MPLTSVMRLYGSMSSSVKVILSLGVPFAFGHEGLSVDDMDDHTRWLFRLAGIKPDVVRKEVVAGVEHLRPAAARKRKKSAKRALHDLMVSICWPCCSELGAKFTMLGVAS